MRIANMTETVLRTSLRTPNLSQLSPTPSLSVSNASISTHLSNASYQSSLQQSESSVTMTAHSPGASTQTTTQQLQFLKQRKLDLEKRLTEKNSLLQQLCRQEAQIIGCYDFDQPTDGKSSTLRRKVGTAFKLPENLLNGTSDKEDEIKELLLAKQVQQQISEASLKLANDLSQTKAIRRTHKNNYETAQQKLNAINQSLSALKKRQNCDVVSSTTGVVYQSQFKQPSPTTKSTTDVKYATNNNNFLHSTSQVSPTQFNNNFIGSATNTHQLLMKAYSAHGNISPNINNNQNSMMQRRNSMISNTSSTNIETQMPTTPTSSRIRHETFAIPFDYAGHQHVHYNNASNNNKPDFSVSVNTLNQHKHLKKSALLDNDYNLQRYSPISCDTDTFNYPNYYNQYSPGDIISTTTTDFRSSPQMGRLAMPNQIVDQEPNQTRPFPVCYQQPILHGGRKFVDGNVYNQRLDVAVDGTFTNESWNGRLLSPPITSNGTLMIQQGLGGYWMTLDNNERVWCAVDRFASLDRKGQSLKLRKQLPATLQKQPAISTSLGNIEHISKQNIDETVDNLSMSSMSSDQKKFKEKQWIETSLDCPTIKANDQSQRKLLTPSPPPPTLHQREKKKLSSHSMHSPGRNNYMYVSPSNSSQDKPLSQASHMGLDTNFSHSVSSLAPAGKSMCQTLHEFANQKTKPQPIPPKQPYPLPPPTSNAITAQLNQHRQLSQQQQLLLSPTRPPQQMQLRRTASSVSTTSNNLLNNPANIRIESPKNITVVQPAKFQPYKEESKPFEMSDFYKYSTKFRQKNIDGDGVVDG